jgi:DMSO/TMAO reductase YedYZ molybdopterin-dependent catalytic subunit
MQQDEPQLRDGRIVRGEDPLNLEMPFETLESFITPTKSFYVRTHFPIPPIDRDEWWLHVEGEVEKPFAINYEELLKLESLTIPVTLECAGNNRNFLERKVRCAMGTRCGRHGGMDRRSLIDLAGPRRSENERA